MTRFIARTRPRRWVAAGLAALVAAGGCQTMTPKSTTTTSSNTNPPGGAEPGGPKTEFHRQVGPEQEFNVHLELARFHETEGNHEAAVVEYQKATEVCERKGAVMAHSKLGPAQQALAQRRMAAALDRLGRFAQAETHYMKALKLAPGDAKVWNDAGYSYYLQNRLADAERALKTADSLDPNNPRVLTNLGLTRAAQGKTDEALAALTRAGGPAVGRANLGYILAAMGKTDEARQQYQSALALQPGLAAARQALVKLDAAPAAAAAAPTALASAAKPATPPAVVMRPSTPQEFIPMPVRIAARPAPASGMKDPQLARTSGASSPPAAAPAR